MSGIACYQEGVCAAVVERFCDHLASEWILMKTVIIPGGILHGNLGHWMSSRPFASRVLRVSSREVTLKYLYIDNTINIFHFVAAISSPHL